MKLKLFKFMTPSFTQRLVSSLFPFFLLWLYIKPVRDNEYGSQMLLNISLSHGTISYQITYIKNRVQRCKQQLLDTATQLSLQPSTSKKLNKQTWEWAWPTWKPYNRKRWNKRSIYENNSSTMTLQGMRIRIEVKRKQNEKFSR